MFVEKVFPTTLMEKIYYSRLFVSNIYIPTGKEELATNFFFITNKVKNYFLNGASEEKMSTRRPPVIRRDIIRNHFQVSLSKCESDWGT